MVKKYSVFLLLLIMLSCNNRTQKNDDMPVEVLVDRNYSIWDREPFADSTWYNLIVEAWEKRDTVALRPFFESWYQHTLKTDCTSDMPYRTVMDTIIRVIYENCWYNTPPPEPDPEFYLSNGIPIPEKLQFRRMNCLTANLGVNMQFSIGKCAILL